MIIVIGSLRIRNYSPYGYVIEQKKVKAGWRVKSYHRTLAQAAQDLFEERIREGTSNDTISAENVAAARACTVEISNKLEAIADELREALHDRD